MYSYPCLFLLYPAVYLYETCDVPTLPCLVVMRITPLLARAP